MPFDGTSPPSQVALALLEGRRQVERGWCQGSSVTEGRVCLIAAIRGAPDYAVYCAARNLLWAEVRRFGFGGSPVEFNDTPGRTKEEVLAVYDAALAEAFNAP